MIIFYNGNWIYLNIILKKLTPFIFNDCSVQKMKIFDSTFE